jgi:flagellar L-ring protein precursor FlgH
LVLLLCGVLTSCAAQQIRPHNARERQYDIGEYEASPAPVSDGSLWTNASSGLFADFRARSVGDIVTIRIDETARASGDASTDTEREQSMSMGMPNFFGFTAALQAAHPDIDTSNLMELMSEHNFSAQGETSRGSRVRGTLAVRVRRELPNHDLYIEGTKVILVNDEELHIYISGVIRPEDIEQDNSVRSSLVADAQIQFSGRGSLSENNERGWLARLLSRVRPF